MLTILLVEDDESLRGVLARALARRNDVFAVDGFAAACATLDAVTPDLVISDVGLTDGSGLDLARHIRARRGPRMAVVLMSGFGVERVDALHAGADEFVPKPFRLEELFSRCSDVLARTGRRLELED